MNIRLIGYYVLILILLFMLALMFYYYLLLRRKISINRRTNGVDGFSRGNK